MTNESGRSMVEMLGVLAIIGVLSIGGIAGYTLAMNRYRANEALNLASQVAIIAATANGGAGQETTITNAANGTAAIGGGVQMPTGVTQITSTDGRSAAITVTDSAVADIIHQLAGESRNKGGCTTSGCVISFS